jgi:outer membrane scaffolding protein for murein synthesis (MipA/OmpV family)
VSRITAFATLAIIWGGLTHALLPTAALAANANGTDSIGPWSATLGGGAWTHPRFPGSDSAYVQPLPYFDVRYRDRFFLVSGDGLGAYLTHSHGSWTAVSIAPELRQRLQSADDRLRGLGDVPRTARAEFQAGYAAGCWTAKADVATDNAHRGQGTIFDLVLAAHQTSLASVHAESGVALMWANRQFNRSFFGITAAQSMASGLPEHPRAAA